MMYGQKNIKIPKSV